MTAPSIDWSTAEVKGEKLTVKLAGDVPKGWKATFQTTVKLLGGGPVGEIKLGKQKAEISGATPGGEEKLRQFLESVVQQANAAHETPEKDSDEADEERAENGGESEDDQSGQDRNPDAEMSDRFRSFAERDHPPE